MSGMMSLIPESHSPLPPAGQRNPAGQPGVVSTLEPSCSGQFPGARFGHSGTGRSDELLVEFGQIQASTAALNLCVLSLPTREPPVRVATLSPVNRSIRLRIQPARNELFTAIGPLAQISGKESIMKNLATEASPNVANLAFSTEQGSSSAHQAIDRLSDAVHPAVSRATSGAHRLVDRIGGTTSRVAQQFEKTTTLLKDREQRLVAASNSYAREHPFQLAGMAMAAGFVVSRLFSSHKAD